MNIFMIGTQRSGSNLLRLMLNELPRIAAPHPPHILQRLMPLVPNYGDLEQRENFAHFASSRETRIRVFQRLSRAREGVLRLAHMV